MVEQGRSADRDTDSVRGKTPLQGGSEKRISPRNISAEHQYVRVETGKDRTRELRQLFAVDVEKTARSRIGVVPGGDLPRTGQGLAGQLFVTADNSARREGFIHDSVAERQAVDPAVGRHLIARSHQFTVGHETRPDACSEREGHHAPGIARRAAEALAQRKGRSVVDIAELFGSGPQQQREKRPETVADLMQQLTDLQLALCELYERSDA